MDNFNLQGASYCRFNRTDVKGFLSAVNLAKETSRILNENIGSFEVKLSGEDKVPHVLLSTSVSKGFSDSTQSWPNAVNTFKQEMVYPPTLFVNAYECAGWGYALRLLSRYYKKNSYVLLSILDLNLEQLSFWDESDAWGNSGFGVSTMLFKIGDAGAIKVAKSVSNNPMADFCMNIKRQGKIINTNILATPFFPQKTQKLNDRILSSFDRLDDRHVEMGHCFGSDPWISMIKTGLKLKGKSMLASSLAYSGYWCVLGLDVDEGTSFNYFESDFIINENVAPIDCTCNHKDLNKLTYELISSPVRSTLIESLSLKLPLKTSLDFSVFSNVSSSYQCFVTPNTKYSSLKRFSEVILDKCDFLVLRIPAPSTIPIPNIFLSDDVFCCVDSEFFLGEFMLSHELESKKTVSVSDRSYIPYIDQYGDNTLTIMGDEPVVNALKNVSNLSSYRKVLE